MINRFAFYICNNCKIVYIFLWVISGFVTHFWHTVYGHIFCRSDANIGINSIIFTSVTGLASGLASVTGLASGLASVTGLASGLASVTG